MSRACAQDLLEAVERVLPGWVERSVADRMTAWTGRVPPDVAARARQQGERARDELLPRLRRLLEADVDEQRTNPLAVLRAGTRYATEVLAEAGVPPVVRDEFAERLFPADVYDLAPANFGDVDPSLAEPGIRWGAAKAHVVLTRRRRAGAGGRPDGGDLPPGGERA